MKDDAYTSTRYNLWLSNGSGSWLYSTGTWEPFIPVSVPVGNLQLGLYDVKIEVSDGELNDSCCRTFRVVENAFPRVNIPDRIETEAGFPPVINATITDYVHSNLLYAWQFNDSVLEYKSLNNSFNYRLLENASYIPSLPGRYTIKLHLVDELLKQHCTYPVEVEVRNNFDPVISAISEIVISQNEAFNLSGTVTDWNFTDAAEIELKLNNFKP